MTSALKFRKKPIVIEAFRYGVDDAPDWFTVPPGITGFMGFCIIKTLEGDMRGEQGDYIIKGVKGEVYPCKPDIFEATYEPVESDS